MIIVNQASIFGQNGFLKAIIKKDVISNTGLEFGYRRTLTFGLQLQSGNDDIFQNQLLTSFKVPQWVV
jgi:hypothetical protein